MSTFSTGPVSYAGTTEVTLPPVAHNRIEHLAQQGSAGASMMANSDLLLLDQIGLEPVGVVVGLSVIHLGQIQLAGLKAPVEMVAHSQALTMGWANALTRMIQEADMLGADGVFLQHSNEKRFDGEEHEYSFRGTAVRFRPQPGALRNPNGTPFVCSTTAMSLYVYLRYGLAPVSIRFDACVYHVPHRTIRQALGQTFQNSEVPVFTEGWYSAREIALSRLQVGLEQAGSEMILGVSVEEQAEAFGEHTAEFRAFGRGWRRMPALKDMIPEADLTLSALIDRDGVYPGTLIERQQH